MPTSITEIGRLHYDITGDGKNLSRAVKQVRQESEAEIDKLTRKFAKAADDQVKAQEAGNKRAAAAAKGRQRQIATQLDDELKLYRQHNAVISNLAPSGFFEKIQKGFESNLGGNSGALLNMLGFAAVGTAAVAIGSKVVEVAGQIIQFGLSKAIEAGVKAADIERSLIGLKAVTGSGAEANRTLEEMIAMSRRVPGLQFESALIGAQRLRTVGFTAEQTTKAIEGLANVKLLSGSTNQDMDAVLLNFQQIRSYGKLTGDELRETLMRMPAMSLAFQDAFGTISTEKIKDLKLSSDELFDRLFAAMEHLPKVTGGAATAWEKLVNEYTIAQTAFGTPILEPISLALNDLTDYLKRNEKGWAEWGEYVGNVIRGAREVAKGTGSPAVDPQSEMLKIIAWQSLKGGAMGLADQATFGLATLGSSTLSGLNYLGSQAAPTGRKGTFSGAKMSMKSVGSRAADDAEVRMYQETTRNIEKQYDIRIRDTENFYTMQRASVMGFLRETPEAELNYQRQVTEITHNEQVSRIAILEKEIEDKRKLNDKYINSFMPQDRARIKAAKELELSDKVSQLQKEKSALALADAQAKETILKLERAFTDDISRISTKRRDMQLSIFAQGYKLQEAYVKSTAPLVLEQEQEQLAAVNNLREVNFNRQRATQQAWYDEQVKLHKDNKTRLMEIEQENFTVLSNLNGEFQLSSIASEQQAARIRQQIRERDADHAARSYAALAAQYAAIGSMFSASSVSQNNLSSLLNIGNGGELRNTQLNLARQMDAFKAFIDGGGTAKSSVGGGFSLVISELTKKMKALKLVTPDVVEEVSSLAASLATTGDVTIFDQIAVKVLEAETILKRQTLKGKIEEAEEALKNLEGGARYAMNQTLKGLRQEFEGLDAALEVQKLNAYSVSLKGLAETLAELRSGKGPKVTALEFLNKQSKLNEEIQVRQEIGMADIRLAETAEAVADRILLAHKNTAIEIKSQWEQAMIAIDKAQQEMAQKTIYQHTLVLQKVSTAIASAPGITDIIGDAEAGAITDFYKMLDDSVGSLVERLGLADTALGNFFQTMLAGLAKLAAAKVFEMLFGIQTNGTQATNNSGGGGWLGRILGMVIGAFGGSVGGGGGSSSNGYGSTGNPWGLPGGMLTPRANGGPVSAGSGYIWNEQGAEMFVPSTDGYILNHEDAMAAVGGSRRGNVFNFNFQANPQTGKFNQESAEQAARKMMSLQKKIAGR